MFSICYKMIVKNDNQNANNLFMNLAEERKKYDVYIKVVVANDQ